MRITIITEYFPRSTRGEVRGGVEARCFYLGKELARRHAVSIITSWSEGLKREEIINGMRVFRVGPSHPYTHKGAFVSRLQFAHAAKKEAMRISADIVDGANFISYLPAFAAAQYQNIPAIATYHEVWLGSWVKNKGLLTGVLGSIWERLVLSKMWDRIIAVSAFTKQALIDQGIPGRIIDIVSNGVDLHEYKKTGKRNNPPTICCISRLTPQKRVEDLIHALGILKQKIPKIQAIIIGVGDEEARLKNLTKELGVEKSVHFLGFVEERKKVIAYLQSSHVFCLPSVVEGFGMVIIEAMAAGIPYVCTDIAPLQEITKGGKGGLLSRQKDSKDLAAKLLLLLQNKQLYAKKVKESRNLAKQYDWQDIAKQVETTYKRAIEART